MEKFENWCEEWTDKALIKTRLLAFMEWDERNPLAECTKIKARVFNDENDLIQPSA